MNKRLYRSEKDMFLGVCAPDWVITLGSIRRSSA